MAEDAASHTVRNSTETQPQGCPKYWATSCPSCSTISILWCFPLLTYKHLPRQHLSMICRRALENHRKSSLCHLQTPDTAPPGTALRHIQVPQSTCHNFCVLQLLQYSPQTVCSKNCELENKNSDSKNVLDPTMG